MYTKSILKIDTLYRCKELLHLEVVLILVAFYPFHLNLYCLLKFKYSEQGNISESKDLREEHSMHKILRQE